MNQEEALNQLADLLGEYLAVFLDWSETEIQGEAEGIRDLVVSGVPLLMAAMGAERETITGWTQSPGCERVYDIQERWVTPWQEVDDGR